MVVRGKIQGKLETKLEQLEVGQEGFTLPWALSLEPAENSKYNVYLNLQYPVSPIKRGTLQLHIKRIGPHAKDFEVDLDSPDYQWSIGKSSYMGANPKDIVCVGQIDMF